MKRSKQATLTLMAASSALALSACDSKPQETEETQAHTYKNLEVCKSAGIFSEQECSEEFEKALATHESSAPRYASESLCEKEFRLNNCYQRSISGNSFWSPFMTGFVVSQLLNNNQNHYYSSPYYQSARGSYLTGDGSAINIRRSEDGRLRNTISTKSITTKPKPAKIMTHTSVISRGGFGARTKSRSSSRSSWGG